MTEHECDRHDAQLAQIRTATTQALQRIHKLNEETLLVRWQRLALPWATLATVVVATTALVTALVAVVSRLVAL